MSTNEQPTNEPSVAPTSATSQRKRYPRRGFASMDPEQQRQIASSGGRTAHKKGVAYQWSSAEAREAGRRGGLKSAERRRQAKAEREQLNG